ncbi:MAG TPA: NAD-dependent epimerase/dehydratase family protein [Symbiobacteriaceae bacterium]|jgi:nucleoside-diphosphate-sugar epimerase
MARFLVTGAGGFIGSHLMRRLIAGGHDAIGVDRRPVSVAGARPPASGAGARPPWVEGDLLLMDLAPLLAGAEYVVHLAGQPGVRESWAQFPAYARGNIETTQRLLEALRGGSVRKFVLASTSSVYGSAPMPAREDGPALPVSPYGATKLAAEQIADLYGRTASIPWVALRYFTVYGPGQRPDMAFTRWLKAARDGVPIELYGRGDQVRDFTYVDDAVEATIRAALTPAATGMAINVGGGSPVAIRDTLAVIERVSGRLLQVEMRPPAPGDMALTRADTTRLAAQLGFVPATPLADGIARQYAWITGGGA